MFSFRIKFPGYTESIFEVWARTNVDAIQSARVIAELPCEAVASGRVLSAVRVTN